MKIHAYVFGKLHFLQMFTPHEKVHPHHQWSIRIHYWTHLITFGYRNNLEISVAICDRPLVYVSNASHRHDRIRGPEGYLSDIFNASNLYREHHLCSKIMELMEKGERVIVTMGSSHAFRIRRSLENELK